MLRLWIKRFKFSLFFFQQYSDCALFYLWSLCHSVKHVHLLLYKLQKQLSHTGYKYVSFNGNPLIHQHLNFIICFFLFVVFVAFDDVNFATIIKTIEILIKHSVFRWALKNPFQFKHLHLHFCIYLKSIYIHIIKCRKINIRKCWNQMA